MENNFPSPSSAGLPIRFGSNAFGPGSTVLAFLGMLAVVAVVAVVSIAAYVAVTHGNLAALTRPSNELGIISQGAIDLGVGLYVLLVVPALAKTSLAGIGFRVPRLRDIGIAIAGAVAMIVVVNGLGTLIEQLAHGKHQQQAVELFLSIHNPALRALFVGLAVVAAPFGEEMAFRVFVFNAVRSWGGFWIGAVISGLLFGAAHWDKYAFIPLVFGGMILCGVYRRSGNASMSMITHALFNATSLALLFFAPQTAR